MLVDRLHEVLFGFSARQHRWPLNVNGRLQVMNLRLHRRVLRLQVNDASLRGRHRVADLVVQLLVLVELDHELVLHVKLLGAHCFLLQFEILQLLNLVLLALQVTSIFIALHGLNLYLALHLANTILQLGRTIVEMDYFCVLLMYFLLKTIQLQFVASLW